jgi:hypothetical protein
MALRSFLYGSRVYGKIIDNSAMYSEKRITIPTPEFYVLYNGIEPFPDKAVYHPSDSFAQPAGCEPALELMVTIYNVNKGHNDDIVKRSVHLHGYVTLVAIAREHEQNGLSRPMAVEKAIKECISLGILTDYLNSSASEVLNMLLHEWNIEDAKVVWQKEAEERGMERGARLGEERGVRLGEERSDQKWRSVIADKDALIAELQARLCNGN